MAILEGGQGDPAGKENLSKSPEVKECTSGRLGEKGSRQREQSVPSP